MEQAQAVIAKYRLQSKIDPLAQARQFDGRRYLVGPAEWQQDQQIETFKGALDATQQLAGRHPVQSLALRNDFEVSNKIDRATVKDSVGAIVIGEEHLDRSRKLLLEIGHGCAISKCDVVLNQGPVWLFLLGEGWIRSNEIVDKRRLAAAMSSTNGDPHQVATTRNPPLIRAPTLQNGAFRVPHAPGLPRL